MIRLYIDDIDKMKFRTEIGTQRSIPLHHDFLFVRIHMHLRPSPLRRRS